MRILIVYPPCRESHVPVLPLGLLYITQSLIDDGHSVKFFDIALEKPTRDAVISRIKSEKFDLMITGGIITTYGYIKWLTKEVKKIYPDIPIMCGGFVATPIPHIIFKNTGVDVICNAEGDITVREYASKVENTEDISNVHGIFIKNGDSFYSTPERLLIKNLDEIPPPIDAYKLLDVDKYIIENGKAMQAVMESEGKWGSNMGECRYFDIISGRGCIGNCTFCYRMIRGMRKHSVPYVIKHMMYLADNYKINFFQFEDDLFVTDQQWVNDFCTSLKNTKKDIRFSISCRANLINDDLLIQLKSAGCVHVGVGFESGSQRMLDSMKKHVKVEHNYNAYRLLKKHGLIMGAPTIIGMPCENKESIKETLKFIHDCNVDIAANYFATPYPNSDIYQYAIKESLIKDEEKYLELISNSDAAVFKINLTKLSDTDLLYYRFLLNDACKKNKFQNEPKNNRYEYYKFLTRHHGIKLLYNLGLYKFVWTINNYNENKNRLKYKI